MREKLYQNLLSSSFQKRDASVEAEVYGDKAIIITRYTKLNFFSNSSLGQYSLVSERYKGLRKTRQYDREGSCGDLDGSFSGPIDEGKRIDSNARSFRIERGIVERHRDTVRFTCHAHFRPRERSRGPISRSRVRQVLRDPSSCRRNARDGGVWTSRAPGRKPSIWYHRKMRLGITRVCKKLIQLGPEETRRDVRGHHDFRYSKKSNIFQMQLLYDRK